MKKCFVAYSKSNDRLLSSSGGIYAEIAKYILNEKGINLCKCL